MADKKVPDKKVQLKVSTRKTEALKKKRKSLKEQQEALRDAKAGVEKSSEDVSNMKKKTLRRSGVRSMGKSGDLQAFVKAMNSQNERLSRKFEKAEEALKNLRNETTSQMKKNASEMGKISKDLETESTKRERIKEAMEKQKQAGKEAGKKRVSSTRRGLALGERIKAFMQELEAQAAAKAERAARVKAMEKQRKEAALRAEKVVKERAEAKKQQEAVRKRLKEDATELKKRMAKIKQGLKKVAANMNKENRKSSSIRAEAEIINAWLQFKEDLEEYYQEVTDLGDAPDTGLHPDKVEAMP
jgi:chromosome segregation ATPase